MFTEIYSERWINNIYFDTPAYDFCIDNQYGKSNRRKMRIRWYGDLYGKVDTPILEFKIKNGLSGTKKSYVLDNFEIGRNGELPNFKDLFRNADLPDEIEMLTSLIRPALINRYRRKYFLDYSKNFRLTLDSDMYYYDVQSDTANFKNEIFHRSKMVLELKYDLKHDPEASYYTSYFPYRMNKHSKYVNGIEAFRSFSD